MILKPGERQLRKQDATYVRSKEELGTLTLTNERLVFEIYVKAGFRHAVGRTVLEVLLDNLQSSQATPGTGGAGAAPGSLQVQTAKGIDRFDLDRPEEWVEEISNAKLARPPVPGSAPAPAPSITVNVNVAPTGGLPAPPPPIRVRCPYCRSVYDEAKGRCPSCGARFY